MEALLQDVITHSEKRFSGECNTLELRCCVNEIWPFEGNFDIVNVIGSTSKFKAGIHADLKTQEDIKMLVNNYKIKNGETLRISRRRENTGKYKLVEYYRCQHNTRNESTRSTGKILAENPCKRLKNTNCPFSLIVKLLKDPEVTSNERQAVIDLEWDHNHPVTSFHAMSFKDIQASTIEEIKMLFEERRMLPGAAYKYFLSQIRSECSSKKEVQEKLADRSIVPRRADFNKIYQLFKSEKYGTGCLADMFAILEHKVEELKKQECGYLINHQRFVEEFNQPFILTIVSPLMQRVHDKIMNAKDLVFVDSSSNMEEYNLRVFIFVTHSVCGALPLGIVITSDETTSTLISAFKMFENSLPPCSFHGSGFPKVFMTDNCCELRDALISIWPQSEALLCIFHMLQQVWRWLQDSKNGINHLQKPFILKQFKSMLYKKDENEFEESYKAMLQDKKIKKYPNFLSYLEGLYSYKKFWALYYRKDLPMRGNHTNNYCEAQFLVMKDDMLHRQKEINVIGLLDKLTTSLDDHYSNKLLSVASGRFDGIYSRRYKSFAGKSSQNEHPYSEIAFENVVCHGEGVFTVPSATDKEMQYMVDMNCGFCECPVGKDGSPCKHQFVLWSNQAGGDCINFLPKFSKQQRQMFAYVALGYSAPLERFEDLHSKTSQTLADDNLSTQLDTPFISPYDECNANDGLVSHDDFVPSQEVALTSNVSISKESCMHAFNQACTVLKTYMEVDDQNFRKGVMKFATKINKLSKSRVASGLHSFCSDSFSPSCNTAGTSIMKKHSRGKIGVQPAAVAKRRKRRADEPPPGSRQKQTKGNIRINPFRPASGKSKRRHNLAENVQNNQNAPKKAGRSMSSRTTTRATKKT